MTAAVVTSFPFFAKKRPVGGANGIDKQLRELYHLHGGSGHTVAELPLRRSRRINVGIVVAEDVRTVCAHIVYEAVAVNVPETAALRPFREERKGIDRDIAPLSGP